jgi:hypothetical protein
MSLERFRADEDGYAMVLAIVLTSVMMVFTLGMMNTAVHLETQTVRDVSWNRALDVAEAGVDRALYEIGKSPTYTGVTGLAVPGGEVDVQVVASAAGYITLYATGYSPSKTATDVKKRRIKVVYGPEDVFDFALFSSTGITLKNNGTTHGDVFANNSVYFENNSTVYGSVTSANGTVELTNGAMIRAEDDRLGNVYTGGYDASGLWGLKLANNAVVEGSAYAQAETCPGTTADDSRYNIVASGTIKGNATARGSISGSVNGTRTPRNCQLRASNRTLPSYTWDADLYTGEVEYTSIASFNTWLSAHQSSLSGVVRLWDPICSSSPSGASSVISMNGATVTGDFVFDTNCRVDANNDFTVSAPSSSVVNIIVQNASSSPAAVTIKNNLTVTNDAAVLFYSTGLIDVKNNLDEQGAVYSGAIAVKNNMDVVYDARVERSLGFGDVKYDRISWQECKASSTGTNC